MKARTKEEKFLIAVYEAASALGNLNAELDRFVIGQKLGLHPRGINTICNVLAQANFIKKRGPELIMITENGRRLFEDLRSGV
jgi:hypothetical protein